MSIEVITDEFNLAARSVLWCKCDSLPEGFR